MDILFCLTLVGFIFYTSIILPWKTSFRIKRLENDLNFLRSKSLEIPVVEKKQTPVETKLVPEVNLVSTPPDPETIDLPLSRFSKPEQVAEKPKAEPVASLEHQFGAKLPVWIGGIAIALAGFFLVKYSLEKNLISPPVRLCLSAMLGLGLLITAKFIRERPNFANGIRIAQSLAGAGIAVLYFTSYASVKLFHILPNNMGFILMTLVTAGALYLALKHGAPIALMGLVGGFITPVLMHGNSGNAFALFSYLFFISTGLLIVARKSNWGWLSLFTILLSWGWVLFWLMDDYTGGDGFVLGLFLFGLTATLLFTSQNKADKTSELVIDTDLDLTSILSYVGVGGSIILMAVVVGQSGFGLWEWAFFALFAVSSVILAGFNQKVYWFAPIISSFANLLMLDAWNSESDIRFLIILICFASIYIIGAYLLFWKSIRPRLFAYLIAMTSISYYLLAFYRLEHSKDDFINSIPHFWGLTSLAIATLSGLTTYLVYKKYKANEYKDNLLAVFSALTTFFLSFAIYNEMDQEFLSVACATEILAIAYIYSKLNVSGLKLCAKALVVCFCILLIPQIILLIQLTFFSISEIRLNYQTDLPIVKWPVFQLGLPAAMFITASYLFRKREDSGLIRFLESISIALFALMVYYLIRNYRHPNENVIFIKAGFFERGLISNSIFIFGLTCLYLGKRFERIAFIGGGTVLCVIAIYRIYLFDLLLKNPYWSMESIGGIVIFNSLLITYGLPVIWTFIMNRLEEGRYALSRGIFMLVMVFSLISFNVRFAFNGSYLNYFNAKYMSNAEIYTYSVAWLLLGILLLLVGITKKSKMFRYSSLVIILVSVAKVFLVDASELQGLYRVFSFLGLGLCLIGLSYFYTKFVFNKDEE